MEAVTKFMKMIPGCFFLTLLFRLLSLAQEGWVV